MMTIAEIFREEGLEEGIEKGETKALVRTAIKLLTKKFGSLSEELKIKISKLDVPTLDAIVEGILDYKSLEDVERHFWQQR